MNRIRPRASRGRLGAIALYFLGAQALLLLTSGEAAAWDPIRSAGKSLGGGLSEGLGLPTLPGKLEDSGHRLIADVNGKLEQRLDQIQGTLSGTVSDLNVVATDRLNQADGIMEARIAQLGQVANAAVGAAVGGLDVVAKNSIKRFEATGIVLITKLSEEQGKALNRVDEILQDRIGQMDDVVARSLSDVDEILRKRIEQVDELTERRLGNADMIVTRQGVALENSLLEVGKWFGLLAFVVYVCVQGVKDFNEKWGENTERDYWTNVKLSILNALKWLVGRVATATLFVVPIYLLATHVPSRSQDCLEAIVAQTERDFTTSCGALDFPRVRFYESQLQLLEPQSKKRDFYRYEARKYELARNVLSRGALLKTEQGVRDVVGELRALEMQGQPDADLLALKAYVWFRVSQLSESRDGEWEAAKVARQALAAPSASSGAPPAFKPLAAAVLRALLADPVPESGVARELAQLQESLKGFGDGAFSHLEHAAAYDAAVIKLNQKSSSAFVEMIEAHAEAKKARQALGKVEVTFTFTKEGGVETAGLDPKRAALAKALDVRRAAARAVVAAWTEFDDALETNEAMAGSNVVFNAFMLNDAILTQALWVDNQPESGTLAPRIKEIKDEKLRLLITPVRVQWARRYGGNFVRGTSWMFGFEESRRFERYETQVQTFITAFLDLRAPDPQPEPRTKPKTKLPEPPPGSKELIAARAAGELGLYTGSESSREAYGLKLLGAEPPADAKAVVLAEYKKRHVQLL